MPKSRLGRGLDILIPTGEGLPESDGGQLLVAVDLIEPNPFQPRKDFGEGEMLSLVKSVQAKGILQPLSVRDMSAGHYQLVAGERRLRAARLAGLKKVPVYILSVESDVDMVEYALIENIQRQDLNPVEQAEAFALLHSKYDLKQDAIAKQVGMSRPAVANYLRILKLPSEIKDSLAGGEISMGHARSLLALPQPALMQKLWKEIMKKGLSVRQTETAVQTLTGFRRKSTETARGGTPKMAPTAQRLSFLNHVEVELLARLSTKVRIKPKDDRAGTIEIAYYSQDDLERIVEIIIPERDQEPVN